MPGFPDWFNLFIQQAGIPPEAAGQLWTLYGQQGGDPGGIIPGPNDGGPVVGGPAGTIAIPGTPGTNFGGAANVLASDPGASGIGISPNNGGAQPGGQPPPPPPPAGPTGPSAGPRPTEPPGGETHFTGAWALTRRPGDPVARWTWRRSAPSEVAPPPTPQVSTQTPAVPDPNTQQRPQVASDDAPNGPDPSNPPGPPPPADPYSRANAPNTSLAASSRPATANNFSGGNALQPQWPPRRPTIGSNTFAAQRRVPRPPKPAGGGLGGL